MRRRPTALPLSILAVGLLSTCDDTPLEPISRFDSRPVIDEGGRITDLVCPGALGCETADGTLRVGVGQRRITPFLEPYDDKNGDLTRNADESFSDLNGDGLWNAAWMAGFDIGRAATGVHDDTYVRAISVRKGDLRIGFVAIDCVGYFVEEVLDIRKVARERGLDFDHIIVASAHNHETKDTLGLWGKDPFSSGYDRPYMMEILVRSIEALAEARLGERDATLEAVQVDVPEFVADSRLPKVIDAAATALVFSDTSARRFASLVVYGNHPESLSDSNTLITSDYPHYLREKLEAHWPGSTTVFFVGSLGGLQNPLGVAGCPDADGNAQCRSGSFEKARYIGEGVANAVIAAFEEGGEILSEANNTFELRRKRFFLGTTNFIFALGFSIGSVRREVFDREGRKMNREQINQIGLDEARAGAIQIQTEVNHVTLGPVEFLTVPGELYPELWLVKPDGGHYLEAPEGADFPDAAFETPLMAEMPKNTRRKVILNQANDSLGYIIPKRQFDEHEPRAYKPNGQYGEQNSLGPDTAPKVNLAVREMYQLTH